MDRDRVEREKEAAGRGTAQRLEDGGIVVDARAVTAQLAAQQARADASPRAAQLQEMADLADAATVQRNDTGMPDSLRSGIESLSGMDMSAVRVHRNSDKPAQLNAHAYAQGTDIHLAPGQERNLPHEAWHVVQQMQGRVQATEQMKNVGINNSVDLEHEADVMGRKADVIGVKASMGVAPVTPRASNVLQRKVGFELEYADVIVTGKNASGPLSKLNPTIKRFEGFEMNVDELNGGAILDLEFVITEVDENSSAARNSALDAARRAMKIHDDVYKNAPATRSGKAQEGFPRTIAFRKHISRSCRLQATAGLDLIALQKVSSDKELHASVAKTVTGDGPRMARVENAAKAGGLNDQVLAVCRKNTKKFWSQVKMNQVVPEAYAGAWLEVLAVLAGHLVQTPVNSRVEVGPYPKAAAGPLLNRSDYATIFRILPVEIRIIMKQFSTTWSLYLLDMIDELLANKQSVKELTDPEELAHNTHSSRKKIHRRSPVMENNWEISGGAPIPDYSNGLNLIDWYSAIVRQEIDYLTKANYPGGEDEKNNLESMGGYGAKFDEPGENSSRNASRPLFEFRKLEPVTESDDVIKQIETILELVYQAHR